LIVATQNDLCDWQAVFASWLVFDEASLQQYATGGSQSGITRDEFLEAYEKA
jgi:hypothetical protein